MAGRGLLKAANLDLSAEHMVICIQENSGVFYLYGYFPVFVLYINQRFSFSK